MENLEQIRTEINKIDDELVRLFVRRLEVVEKVAEAKRASGRPVFDPARERAILSHVAETVGPRYEDGARLLFSTLFNISRARQRDVLDRGGRLSEMIARVRSETPAVFPTRVTVACQGGEGAYSQQAASRLFLFPTITFKPSFDDVFSAVEKGECRYGVLPIENSNAGSVTAVYDLMVRHRFHIVKAIRQRIDHVLLGNRGAALSGIREVLSHPQALAQCSRFLLGHPEIKPVPGSNTALSAKELAEGGRMDLAVIASRSCAELYGLDIIDEGVADSPMNYTRFIVISKAPEIYADSKKFTIQMSLPHKPGTLYYVMAKFAAVNINLTKLENRPIPGSDFEMQFTFDFEASPSDPQVLRLLDELAGDPDVERFTFLGAFPEI